MTYLTLDIKKITVIWVEITVIVSQERRWSHGGEKKDKLRILVVDDEIAILNFFKRLFGKQCLISVAMDADEAIRMVKNLEFNLIFLDVRLPGTSGAEALRDIKKANPNAVVVMMSGYDVESEVRKAMEIGAQEFLPKPVDINRIMTIKEAAEYLKVHQLTIYRLAQKGKIPFSKVGRQWRVKKEILEKWVEQETKRIK
ncbi:hypothetical protein COS16_04635 [Candidatus Desantisbacteria bacterium CG02_land_8_20_14_3_00_49_13]|nr:MAG: hypothetical protein COS16_04635 [Candidatus Desantisbacteria bacterium CG02_land_8_20_14_3_00_49_13]